MQGGAMAAKLITSTANPLIKEAKKLWERRYREKTKLFLIEGYRELSYALKRKYPLRTLLICPELFLGVNEPALIQDALQKGAQIVECSEVIFRSFSYRDRPDGLLAIAHQAPLLLKDLPRTSNPFFVIAEAIEKPGNLGTILRSSDAVGVDGVVVCDRCTDIYNPNVVRASVGTLFTVPVVEAKGDEVMQWLREQGIQIVAATPSAKKLFTEVDLTQKVAIIVGTEQVGLSSKWLDEADLQVKIPMQGTADSLNVATATTLLLYEVLRQRAC